MPRCEDALARYGMHLGTAFQLIDDVLDYSGDQAEIGKNLGDDLAEGKPTLPLIHALQGWLERRRGTDSACDCRAAVSPISSRSSRRSHAPARSTTRGAAPSTESAQATGCLASLPASAYRQSLLELSTFAAERTH